MEPSKCQAAIASLIDLLLPLADQGEHLTSDVAFQAPDHLKLGMAFSHALCHVGLGSRVSPEPPDGNDVQGAVSGSITAPVEAVARRLAGRGWDRADAAEARRSSASECKRSGLSPAVRSSCAAPA